MPLFWPPKIKPQSKALLSDFAKSITGHRALGSKSIFARKHAAQCVFLRMNHRSESRPHSDLTRQFQQICPRLGQARVSSLALGCLAFSRSAIDERHLEHSSGSSLEKSLIALAIAMIPVYIGFYLAHKQQKAATVESAPTGNSESGAWGSF